MLLTKTFNRLGTFQRINCLIVICQKCHIEMVKVIIDTLCHLLMLIIQTQLLSL